MEGVDLRPTLGSQRDVKPPPHRLAMALDEERRSFSVIPAECGGRFGELHQELQSERRERFLVEGLASLVVGNGKPDVIERDHPPSFGGGLKLLVDDRCYALWHPSRTLAQATCAFFNSHSALREGSGCSHLGSTRSLRNGGAHPRVSAGPTYKV